MWMDNPKKAITWFPKNNNYHYFNPWYMLFTQQQYTISQWIENLEAIYRFDNEDQDLSQINLYLKIYPPHKSKPNLQFNPISLNYCFT